MTMQQYCLRWNNHQPNFISVFSSLLNSESLVDVTLAAEGRHLQAHKVVLSACSSYFQSLFTINPCQHPIVILKDVKFVDLKIMVDFMYYGEVNVSQEQLPHILKTAEMLKIKGLAEIPVDQSISRQDNTSDRAELLTTVDTSWNNEPIQNQSSPSPCPSSPSCRRKRLRKSSTGSGSGSLEKSVEESHLGDSAHTNISVETVIKSDPSYNMDNITSQKKQSSSDSELQRGSSHESSEGSLKQHIHLPISQQEYTTIQTITDTNIEVPKPSTSTSHPSDCHKPNVTTHAQLSQQFIHHSQLAMGTKRGRFLMRQQRIKKENDGNHPCDGDPPSVHYLAVPPMRMERQCSDPLPTNSPPPGSLLAVPGSVLLKQHSHPLLLSQSRSFSPPSNIHSFVHSSKLGDQAERAMSPVVVVTDPLSVSQELPLKGDIPQMPTATLRVRTDELKRSVSSPQTSTRSTHCPVVRPGPALGCNYCWNTVDAHGRILRRKTKYHCPECQTNLCIVPCFQEYHERHMNPSQTDPIALTTSVMRVFPKTTSM
ncbi:protein tramtrack, beta isoform isoform X1 [Coccinella septempunctata]|uniref:protein tramtrack, beta isoform isoform X1 n=1 Tax=Coccinella septempunctata TaxID=41139 RepID=UPI001D05E29C|nr:protein tramtrack, beta isoform isoform X1 [Coccinella septempunctata]